MSDTRLRAAKRRSLSEGFEDAQTLSIRIKSGEISPWPCLSCGGDGLSAHGKLCTNRYRCEKQHLCLMCHNYNGSGVGTIPSRIALAAFLGHQGARDYIGQPLDSDWDIIITVFNEYKYPGLIEQTWEPTDKLPLSVWLDCIGQWKPDLKFQITGIYKIGELALVRWKENTSDDGREPWASAPQRTLRLARDWLQQDLDLNSLAVLKGELLKVFPFTAARSLWHGACALILGVSETGASMSRAIMAAKDWLDEDIIKRTLKDEWLRLVIPPINL